jgi:hypothetical protein
VRTCTAETTNVLDTTELHLEAQGLNWSTLLADNARQTLWQLLWGSAGLRLRLRYCKGRDLCASQVPDLRGGTDNSRTHDRMLGEVLSYK